MSDNTNEIKRSLPEITAGSQEDPRMDTRVADLGPTPVVEGLADVVHIGVEYTDDATTIEVQRREPGVLASERVRLRDAVEELRDIEPDVTSMADDARTWGRAAKLSATAVRHAFTPTRPATGWRKHDKVPPKPMVKDRIPSTKVSPNPSGSVVYPIPGTDQSNWRPTSKK